MSHEGWDLISQGEIMNELNIPYAHLDYGESKVGKTDTLASVFESKYFKHEEILYLDNHGSTKGFGLPKYTPKTPWGVKHLKASKPEKFLEECEEIRSKMARKSGCPYKVLILDDLSEHAQNAVQKRMKSAGSKTIRAWGQHLDAMTEPIRLILPSESGLTVLMTARAMRMADFLEDKTKLMKDGEEMDTIVRPHLQGAFGAWAMFEFDIISFHEMEVKKKDVSYTMDFFPHADRVAGNRFSRKWKTLKIPQVMEDPTFDKVFEIVQKVAQEVEA